MKVYLLRHTSLKIAQDIFYGQSDIDVSENFMYEVSKIKDKIKEMKISTDNINRFSSPLKRCVKLANQIFKNFDQDDRLKELYFGDWEMKSSDQISKSEIENWQENIMDFKIPNGESNLEFFNRLKSFCNENVINCKNEVFVVAHAGSINCIISYLTGIPFDNLVRENWKKIGYGSISALEKVEDKFVIEFLGR